MFIMKICPVCNKPMKGIYLGKEFSFLTMAPNVKHCPQCGHLVRKKPSVWYILSLVAFAFCLGNFKTHWTFAILTVLLGLLVFILFYKMPYIPYVPNKK